MRLDSYVCENNVMLSLVLLQISKLKQKQKLLREIDDNIVLVISFMFSFNFDYD